MLAVAEKAFGTKTDYPRQRRNVRVGSLLQGSAGPVAFQGLWLSPTPGVYCR
jgi:hypothetical protein